MESNYGPEFMVDYLNNLLDQDPDMVNDLMKLYVICNKTIADHPSVQAFSPDQAKKYLGLDGENYIVRLLGILNGFYGPSAPLCMDIDIETGRISKFKIRKGSQ